MHWVKHEAIARTTKTSGDIQESHTGSVNEWVIQEPVIL